MNTEERIKRLERSNRRLSLACCGVCLFVFVGLLLGQSDRDPSRAVLTAKELCIVNDDNDPAITMFTDSKGDGVITVGVGGSGNITIVNRQGLSITSDGRIGVILTSGNSTSFMEFYGERLAPLLSLRVGEHGNRIAVNSTNGESTGQFVVEDERGAAVMLWNGERSRTITPR